MPQPVFSAATSVYAILGDPISHSLSPVIMNSMFRRMEMDRVFLAFRVNRENVSTVFPVLRGLNFAGYVLTMPVKEDVGPFLDEVRAEAELSGAVNCIVRQEDGRLIGYNTDSTGFWTATAEKAGKRVPQSLFILGAGGFAKAAAAQAAIRGVGKIRAASPADAHRETFRRFADRLAERYPGLSTTLVDWSPELWRDAVSEADVIANATPDGLHGKGDLHRVFPYGSAREGAIFFDAVYTPLKTAFLAAAGERGHALVDGLDLLTHQGCASFKLWTGAEASPAVMRADALSFLAAKP